MPGRVSTRRQFARLARSDRRGREDGLGVSYVPSTVADEAFGVAFAIPRGVGGAVDRNRLRRQLRAAMDELRPTLASGLYLIKCDFRLRGVAYSELRERLVLALGRAGAAA